MKNYILLGMLLLAGLSFAEDGYNWMQYSTKSYSCNYNFLEGYWKEPAEYSRWSIVNYLHSEEGCFDAQGEAMEGYLQDMDDAIWGGEGSGMCYYAACPSWGKTPNPTGFRSEMLSYNAAAANFNALYLQGLRQCLSEMTTEERATVYGWIQTQALIYRNCLTEAPACYDCGSG